MTWSNCDQKRVRKVLMPKPGSGENFRRCILSTWPYHQKTMRGRTTVSILQGNWLTRDTKRYNMSLGWNKTMAVNSKLHVWLPSFSVSVESETVFWCWKETCQAENKTSVVLPSILSCCNEWLYLLSPGKQFFFLASPFPGMLLQP